MIAGASKTCGIHELPSLTHTHTHWESFARPLRSKGAREPTPRLQERAFPGPRFSRKAWVNRKGPRSSWILEARGGGTATLPTSACKARLSLRGEERKHNFGSPPTYPSPSRDTHMKRRTAAPSRAASAGAWRGRGERTRGLSPVNA